MHLVRHVGGHQILGAQHHGEPLGAVGHALLLIVEPVELGQIEACQIAQPLARAVAQPEEIAAIRAGRLAHTPHHEFAGSRGLQVLRPLCDFELHANADRVHVFLPLLDQLAAEVVGLSRVLDDERRAVGALPPAIAVAVEKAVGVEQGEGAGAAELAHLRSQVRIEPRRARADELMADDGLAAPHLADLLGGVDGQRDGAAQRHLRGRVAAHDRVLHREVRQRQIGARIAHRIQTALGEVRRDAVVRDGDAGEVLRHLLEKIHFPVQEGEPARLCFFDDADLDAVDHRQLAAREPGHRGFGDGVAGRRLLVVELVAKGRVAVEHDLRAALPAPEHEGTGADRVLVDAVAVGLDDLARDRARHRGVAQHIGQARIAAGQAQLQRVAVEGAQARGLAVVVERLAGQRLRAQRAQAEDLLLLDGRQMRALPARIEVALQAVDVVCRGQLARPTVEGRIVGEEDAGPDADREGLEVVADLGHGDSGRWPQHHRAGEKGVLERRLENVGDDDARVVVRHRRRIETGLGGSKGIAQHLDGRGRAGRCRRLRPGHRRGRQQGSENSSKNASVKARHAPSLRRSTSL